MRRMDSIDIAVCAFFVGALALVNAQTKVRPFRCRYGYYPSGERDGEGF